MSQRFRIFHRGERRSADGRAQAPAVSVHVIVPDGVVLSPETKAALFALAEAASDELDIAAAKAVLDDAKAEMGGGDMLPLIDWIEAQGRRP